MNKPNWINFTPNENIGGSGSENMNITTEPNYDNTSRNFSFQIKQDGSNITKNITIEQQYSEDLFNIGGSFSVSEVIYYVDTNPREFFVTSQKTDNTILTWQIDNSVSIPSWITVVVDSVNSKVTVTGNTVTSDAEFTIILKQTSTGNIATIKIFRKRALMGYSIQSLNDGTVFISANDGIYSNRVNPNVFQIENNYYDLKTNPGAFIQDGLSDSTKFSWGRACKFKNTIFFGCLQGINRFNGTAWYRAYSTSSTRMIQYWNAERNRIENVWSDSANGLFPNNYAAAVNVFLNVNDRVLYNSKRDSNSSQIGKATQIKQQDNSWISIPEDTWTSIGWLWIYNSNPSDCLVDNTHGQERFLVDNNNSLYLWNAANDTYGSNILSGVGVPASHTFNGLCKDGDWYYITYIYNPSYGGARGCIVKFRMVNNSIVSGSSTLIDISTLYGGPNPGILKHEKYIYVPLNNSRYSCIIIDTTKDFILSNFIFLPHNFPITGTPADDNTVGYSTCHPFVLDGRVYISSRGVSRLATGAYNGIEKMKGIREIVNDNGNFYLRATNKSIGFYDKPFWNNEDVYIPGDGLALKYNKSNFSFDYVNYI